MKYASKKLDYVVGFGLYMIPSDLNLKIGILSDYNNNILLAQPNFSLGTNHNINTKEKRSVVIPPPPPIVKRTVTEEPTTPTPSNDEHETNKKTLLWIGIFIFVVYDLFM